MPDLKISQLPPASTPLAGTELVPIVQGGTTDQTTVQAILTSAVPSGTANGVLYLNGSKVVTSGSALTFDGARLTVNSGATSEALRLNATADTYLSFQRSGTGTAYIQSSTGGLLLWNQENTAIQFGVNNAEQMRLTSTGLGIGTSSPAYKLDVNGLIRSAGDAANFLLLEKSANTGVYARWKRPNREYYLALDINNDGGNDFSLYDATAGVTRWTVDSSGNLGLGVTPSAWNSASRAFQVSTAATFWGLSNNQAYVGSNSFYDSLGNFKYIVTDNATQYRQWQGAHAWYTAPSGTAGNAISFTQAMTLDASGNLGVGSTSPVTRLDVTGAENSLQARFGGVASRGLEISTRVEFSTTDSGSVLNAKGAGTGTLVLQTESVDRLEIKNTGQTRFIPLAADPAGAENGDVYYNSSTNKLRLYAAGAWVDLN